MPSKFLSFEPNGPQRVELSWSGMWKNFTVRVDGRDVIRLDGRRELEAGRDAVLGDGSTLRVQLVKQFLGAELHVTRDGKPLPGSNGDPEQQLAAACGLIFFLAGASAIAGVLAIAFHIELLEKLGIGLSSILSGAVMAVLGWLAKRRSLVALILLLVFMAVDLIAGQILLAQSGGTPGTGGVVMRGFFMIFIGRGIPAIRALKRAEAGRARPLPT